MQFRDIGVLAAVIMIVAMLVIPLTSMASKFPYYSKYYIGFNGSTYVDEYARSVAIFYFSYAYCSF